MLFLVACSSRVGTSASDSSQTDSDSADTSSASNPTATASDSGPPMNDAPFPPDELIECGAGWDTTVGGGALSTLGFPRACNPRLQPDIIDGFLCCSTDPATADGTLPAYTGKGITGSPPLYAGEANGAGTWGMCVRTEDIPEGSGLLDAAAANCPVPCDPTWSDDDVSTVCGSGRVCCQTTELGANDCVQDNGVWRPVSGADIGVEGVVPPTNWNNVAHDTHQDPNGNVCLAYAGDNTASEEFLECIQTLSVANRRGYCMALGPGQACPGADPSYVDACEAKN
jgi:hypothetical protein